MNLLDNLSQLKKLDPAASLPSIEAFPLQLHQAWEEIYPLKFNFSPFNKIVLAGMGGSALGGRIIESLYQEELSVPFTTVSDFSLPGFVDAQTLLLVASYSGNTEETSSCLKQGIKQKAQVLALTTGGEIGRLVQKGNLQGAVFSPEHNPLGYPKTAVGYSLGSLLAVLANLRLINLNHLSFRKNLAEFKKIQKNYLSVSLLSRNPAKKLALELAASVPVFVASQPLFGAARCCRNQVNEIAHQHALFFDLPEMSHHLVEAFGKPVFLQKKATYLFFESSLYHPRVQEHLKITRQVLRQRKIKNLSYPLQSHGKLAQVLETVNLGGFLAVYLSLLDHEDPGPEPWIIYFKKKLGRPTH